MNVYRFRNCLLNTAERAVIRDNEHIELTSRTLDLLQYLIENAGKAVTKDDILGKVWGGHFVEESNLPVHISKLRRSLGENRGNRFIETVQGVGYRFVAPVEETGEPEWKETSKNSKPFSNGNSELGVPILNSIAVLPLENESGDPSIDYLVDGLTEGLINGLSHIPGLKVIARNTVFRYKNKDVDIKEVGEFLSVSRILTGRVRLVGEDLTVGVELISAANSVQVWGEQYNAYVTELRTIQSEIVAAISGRLISTPGYESVDIPFTENAESYKFYLKGAYFLNKRTEVAVQKAIECFRRSIVYCPTNAYAHAALVDAYYVVHMLERMSRTEVVALMRPELEALSRVNQSLDMVQLVYGNLKLCYDWNSGGAETHINAALAMNPNLVRAHTIYADIMSVNGDTAAAVRHTNRILILDPISVQSLTRVAATLFKLSRYEDAITLLNEAHEIEPANYATLFVLGVAVAHLGEFDEGIHLLNSSFELQPAVETLAMLGYVEGLRGNDAEARKVIERVKLEFKNHAGHPINLARVYAAIGQKDLACELLEEAFQQRSMDLYALGYDPRWERIRQHPEFQSMINKVRKFGSSDSEQFLR
jgi:TolB-like protein/Flp pilus assembly protein TadD